MVTRRDGRTNSYFGSHTCCYNGSSGNFSCSPPSSPFSRYTLHNESDSCGRYNNSPFRSYFSSCSKRY
ncbi:hypothetical protein LINPERPRIM_LOCUS45242 [Linum perenne]